jgi:hypothetical protein
MNRLFRRTKKLIKGTSTAVLISAAFHFILLILASGWVVFTVIEKHQQKFVPVQVNRPKMDLKKPRVKVQKAAKPRASQRITATRGVQSMPALQLPEVSGVGAGLSGEIGGFELRPDSAEISLFGARDALPIGNDFEGTFYAMELDRHGKKAGISDQKFWAEIRKFFDNDWSPRAFAPYYRAPQKLYATQFIIPPLFSELGPAKFGMGLGEQFDPIHWVIHYKGKIASQTGGRFCFRGIADDILVVRVNKKIVLNATWGEQRAAISDWAPSSKDDRKYFMGHVVAAVGDWFELKAGEPVEMEVLIGETPGGQFSAMLVVQEEGVKYPLNQNGAPILPAFKTAEIPERIIKQIEYTLIEGEVDLKKGPVFNVY